MQQDIDKKFDQFSSMLSQRVSEKNSLWLLRDNLFNSITFRRASEIRVPFKNRYGFAGYLVWWVLKGFKERKDINKLTHLPIEGNAFLFLEQNIAHFMTIFPLFCEAKPDCVAWKCYEEKESRFKETDNVVLILDQWRQFAKLHDFFKIFLTVCYGRYIIGREFCMESRGRFTEYMFQFLAWKRFWKRFLNSSCETIYTSSEDSPVSKALFFIAKQYEVRRIHLCHGFRHAMWQVSQASEMVCNTNGDVNYFKNRVPSECKVVYKPNPRVLEIAKQVGAPENRDFGAKPNLLFISQGPVSVYPPAMRAADLKLLSKMVKDFNAFLRVRPHPRESIALLKEALAEASVHQYEISKETLVEDLRWSNIVSSSWSTGILEAYACGRKCYWVNTNIEQFLVVQELVSEGIGAIYE